MTIYQSRLKFSANAPNLGLTQENWQRLFHFVDTLNWRNLVCMLTHVIDELPTLLVFRLLGDTKVFEFFFSSEIRDSTQEHWQRLFHFVDTLYWRNLVCMLTHVIYRWTSYTTCLPTSWRHKSVWVFSSQKSMIVLKKTDKDYFIS